VGRVITRGRLRLNHWVVLGSSVTGASHIRVASGNQDAIGFAPENGRGSRVAIATADGHGSPKSFRSSEGSRLAVRASLALAAEFIEADAKGVPLALVKSRLEGDAPLRLVRTWRTSVDEDLAHHPLAPAELDGLEASSGPAARKLVELDPYLAYGATLLGGVVGESFAVLWQLGDGDIVAVDENGGARRLVPKDDRLIANETTSLCSKEAWHHFRVVFDASPDPLMLLSTDGLANSFTNDAGFLKFGVDLGRMISSEGVPVVESRMKGWLRQMSDQGSGDDISVLAVFRADPPRFVGAAPSGGIARTLKTRALRIRIHPSLPGGRHNVRAQR